MDVVYRASELGGCSKYLIAKRMGYTEMPPPAKFQEYFARGNIEEARVRGILRERGWVIETGDHEHSPGSGGGILVELPITDTISVTGHLDGRIIDGMYPDEDRLRIWECKRVSPKVFDEFVERGWEAHYDLLERYKWQVSVYMVAEDRELHFTVSDGDRIHHLYRELPFYTELQIKTRVLGIEAAALNDGLPDLCDKPNYPCPFYYLPGHDNDDVDDLDEVVNALALSVVQATAETKRAKDRESELRGDLLTAMGDRKKVRADAATVSVLKSSRTVTAWDELDAFLKLHGKTTADFQRKEDGDEYIRVTPRKANRDSEDRAD